MTSHEQHDPADHGLSDQSKAVRALAPIWQIPAGSVFGVTSFYTEIARKKRYELLISKFAVSAASCR